MQMIRNLQTRSTVISGPEERIVQVLGGLQLWVGARYERQERGTRLSQGHDERVPQAALVLDLSPHVQLVVLHEIPSRQQFDGHLWVDRRRQIRYTRT